MRAVDADALKRKAQKVATEAWKMKITGSVETVLNQFIDWIDDAPTIEPQRKRGTGRWIIKDNPGTGWYRVTCSECGEDVTSTAPCIGFYPNAKVTWDYCPNCGADMRGEPNEAD